MMSAESWTELVEALSTATVEGSHHWSVAGPVAVLRLPNGVVVLRRDWRRSAIGLEVRSEGGELLDELDMVHAPPPDPVVGPVSVAPVVPEPGHRLAEGFAELAAHVWHRASVSATA